MVYEYMSKLYFGKFTFVSKIIQVKQMGQDENKVFRTPNDFTESKYFLEYFRTCT